MGRCTIDGWDNSAHRSGFVGDVMTRYPASTETLNRFSEAAKSPRKTAALIRQMDALKLGFTELRLKAESMKRKPTATAS